MLGLLFSKASTPGLGQPAFILSAPRFKVESPQWMSWLYRPGSQLP